MEQQNTQSIQSVAKAVMTLSAFIIFSNGGGALMWTLTPIAEDFATNSLEQPLNPVLFLFAHYLELCLFMLFVATTYLIGGFFLKKQKLWANILVSIFSVILILVIWGTLIAMIYSFKEQENIVIASSICIFTGLVCSAPLLFFIQFLNKKQVKSQFK